jgi:hypothetical protein
MKNREQDRMMKKIRHSIIADNHRFTTDDVDCNMLLLDLHQTQK